MTVLVLNKDAYRGELSLPLEPGNEFTHLALLALDEGGPPTRSYVKIYPHTYSDGTPSRGLVNELVGYFCAQCADLPSPSRAGLIVLDPSQLSATPPWLDRTVPVLGWWSAEVGKRSLRAILNIDALPHGSIAYSSAVSDARTFLLNRAETSAVIALDDMVANVDRNLGNILAGRDAISLIDHGQTLTGPTWQAAHLFPERVYLNKIRALLGVAFESLSFKSSVMADYAQIGSSVAESLPELRAWLDKLLPPSDAISAHTFIQQRTVLSSAAQRIGVVA